MHVRDRFSAKGPATLKGLLSASLAGLASFTPLLTQAVKVALPGDIPTFLASHFVRFARRTATATLDKVSAGMKLIFAHLTHRFSCLDNLAAWMHIDFP
jgi:hypothetical protein